MKITKYNRKKDAIASNSNASSSSSYSSSGIVAQSQNTTPTLEKHTLWGQQFDGTSDVSGDITNAGNIEANGDITVNSSTDTEGKTIGGNIKADGNVACKQLDADNINGKDINASNSITTTGNITADGNISGNKITGKYISSTGNMSCVNLNARSNVNAKNANISNDLITKNLTVTGQAHFFQLVIDKIRSIGGAFIASPADGFDVDVVEKVDGGYRLYWKQNDGSKERINQWISGDQALCMNMNGAKVGTSHSIENKYYWALVVSTNAGTNPVDKLSNGQYIDSDHNLYNYIQISSTDCDGTVNPEVGDTIVQLGNRNDKEANPNYRGSAEYISTYNSLDSELTPPLLAQYRHIGSVAGHYYDLKYYRKSYFDAKAAKFVGNFSVNTGQSVEDFISDKIDSASSGVPYISDGSDGFVSGHWIIWNSSTKKYKDSGVAAKGQNGKDGSSYKLFPIMESANVHIDGNKSMIKRRLYYQIYKYSNNIPQIVTDGEITGYWGSSEISFTKDYITFVDDVIEYTKDVQFISVDLKINGNIVDRRTVPVTFGNQAVFDVTNNAITSAVQESKTYTDGSITTVNNKISKVEETANGLKTTISDVSGTVDELNGNYQTLSNKVTKIEATANGIKTTISDVSGTVDELNGNYQTLSNKVTEIEATANGIKTTVVGSNVVAGIGNGNYWNGYTSFDENGFTFNFNSSNYLISPVFFDFSGTYTLSFGAWKGTVNVEVFQFTTQYQTTDNPDFSSGTLIASISTKDVDNNDATKMHYSSELGRYYFIIKETTSAAKAFRIRFSTPDSSNAIQKVQIEDGNVPHLFNESYAFNQSQIKQTADEIELRVNDVSLKLSDGIKLNGDTTVNGSVTIQDEDTGFLLTGSNGLTQISPKSIGGYQDFYHKVENSIFLTGNALAYGDTNQGLQPIVFRFNFTKHIGIIPNGKTVKFKNAAISFMKPNSGTVLGGSNISFKIDIYEGNNKIKSLSSTTTNMDLSGNSYISTGGEFKLNFSISAVFDYSYWADDNDGPFKRLASAQCNWGFTFDYPNDNFQLIAYDGHAINFGNNSMVYFGPQASVIKYGDYAIKISADGIQRTNQWYKLGSSKKTHIHGGVSYTDTIESSYVSEFVPINGYNIRQTNSYAGNVYIDQNDDVLEIRNTNGIVNVFLGCPSFFTGKRILIKKIENGGDMDVYAGYTTDQTKYKIIRADTANAVTKFLDYQYCTRAYFSDGTYWIEEWLAW